MVAIEMESTSIQQRRGVGSRGLISTVGVIVLLGVVVLALAWSSSSGGQSSPGSGGLPAAVAPASAGPFLGNKHGCDSEFWAEPNNFGRWEEYSPDQLVGALFTQAGDYKPLSLREALAAPSGAEDVKRVLLREGVTATLNASNDALAYPFAKFTVGVDDRPALVPTINQLLASADNEQQIRDFTSELVAANGLGCPLT